MTNAETKNYELVKENYPEIHNACGKKLVLHFFAKDLDSFKGPRPQNWDWEIINACAPFAMLRGSHRGYAETENINDVDECFDLLLQAFIQLNEPNTNGSRLYISAAMRRSIIKQQNERFKQRNGIYIARLLARFMYLKNNLKQS
jgi:hypothetical protein